MAHQEPEGISVPVVWVGIEETPIQFCNTMICQFDQDMETFIVSFGQANPPALIGTPEEVRAQAEEVAFVPVTPIARISLSRPRMAELRAVLGANADNLEAARTIVGGDPR